jgi:hypothetical protein
LFLLSGLSALLKFPSSSKRCSPLSSIRHGWSTYERSQSNQLVLEEEKRDKPDQKKEKVKDNDERFDLFKGKNTTTIIISTGLLLPLPLVPAGLTKITMVQSAMPHI